MKPAPELLQWSQKGIFSREYELTAGDRVVARVVFRSMLGSLADVTIDNESWTIKRTGLFRPRVTVRRAGSEEDFAVFTPNTWSAKGELAVGGQTFHIERSGWTGAHWELTNDGGGPSPIVNMKMSGMLHQNAEVACSPTADAMPNRFLLATILFYIAEMYAQEEAAAAAVIAAG